MNAIFRFFHRLWYVEREVYVEQGDEPLMVDYASGRMAMAFEGTQHVAVSLWLHDGSVLAAQATQEVKLQIDAGIPLPVRAMLVFDNPDPLRLTRLCVDEVSQIATGEPIALAAFKGSGWVPHHVPRWRMFLRGLRESLRWGPHREIAKP